MLYFREEGDGFPHNGLYVYRMRDPSSAGFILVLGRWWVRARYSKRIKKFFFSYEKREAVTMCLPENTVNPLLETHTGTHYWHDAEDRFVFLRRRKRKSTS